MALPATAVCQQLFSACSAMGGSQWDHSALIRAVELISGHEIG